MKKKLIHVLQRYPEHIPNGDITVKNGEKAGGDRNAMMYYHRIGTPQGDGFIIGQTFDAVPDSMFSRRRPCHEG